MEIKTDIINYSLTMIAIDFHSFGIMIAIAFHSFGITIAINSHSFVHSNLCWGLVNQCDKTCTYGESTDLNELSVGLTKLAGSGLYEFEELKLL